MCVFRLQITIFPPSHSSLSLTIWLGILCEECAPHISLELLCWKDVTNSMKWPKEHVYAITCRLIILFFCFFFLLHLREAIESHTCYPLITFSSEIEDIEFQFFLSLAHSFIFGMCECPMTKLRDWFNQIGMAMRRKRKSLITKDFEKRLFNGIVMLIDLNEF